MTVFLLEDDPVIAAHLVEILEENNQSVELVENLAALTQVCAVKTPDLYVLDRMVPDGDSLNWLARQRAEGDFTPALLLTALGRTEEKTKGYDAGADDYLAKPFEKEELLARVRALLRRAKYHQEKEILTCSGFELRKKARTLFYQSVHVPLSPKEFDLLQLFMDNIGEIISREQLLKQIWQLDFDPGTNVIDVNIGRLRKKLLQSNPNICLETVRRAGFRLKEGL